MSEYAALEARVPALEQEAHHVVPHEIRAVGFGVSALHEEVKAFRAEMQAFREENQQAIQEILRRLPPAAD
jgi:hypothetical protein